MPWIYLYDRYGVAFTVYVPAKLKPPYVDIDFTVRPMPDPRREQPDLPEQEQEVQELANLVQEMVEVTRESAEAAAHDYLKEEDDD